MRWLTRDGVYDIELSGASFVIRDAATGTVWATAVTQLPGYLGDGFDAAQLVPRLDPMLTDGQLAELADRGEHMLAAVLAECERRDHAAARAAAAKPADPAEAAWVEASWAEFEAADAACRGRLTSRAAPPRDPWPMLWTCSDSQFTRWASEELQRWRQFDAGSFTTRAGYYAALGEGEAYSETLHTPDELAARRPVPRVTKPGFVIETTVVPQYRCVVALPGGELVEDPHEAYGHETERAAIHCAKRLMRTAA